MLVEPHERWVGVVGRGRLAVDLHDLGATALPQALTLRLGARVHPDDSRMQYSTVDIDERHRAALTANADGGYRTSGCSHDLPGDIDHPVPPVCWVLFGPAGARTVGKIGGLRAGN